MAKIVGRKKEQQQLEHLLDSLLMSISCQLAINVLSKSGKTATF